MSTTPQPRGGRIWTIGHGNRDFDTVAAALAAAGIQTIVDVRSEPYSKHAPEFSKRNLEEAAASAGFGYRWLGAKLGGRPPADAPTLSEGIAELAGLCEASRVALLCSEANPLGCHRDTILAPALVNVGFEVIHIMPTGELAPYQGTLRFETG